MRDQRKPSRLSISRADHKPASTQDVMVMIAQNDDRLVQLNQVSVTCRQKLSAAKSCLPVLRLTDPGAVGFTANNMTH